MFCFELIFARSDMKYYFLFLDLLFFSFMYEWQTLLNSTRWKSYIMYILCNIEREKKGMETIEYTDKEDTL
jgi:hypothetical protein